MSTSDQLEAQIADQREALAATADALGQKLDQAKPSRSIVLGGAAAVVAAVVVLAWWRHRA
jgi:putative NADH-flavin reductase